MDQYNHRLSVSHHNLFRMELITPSELEKIEKLKEKFKAIGKAELEDDDLESTHVVCWLRARKGDVQEAEKMFREHLNWKATINMESIFAEKFPSSWGREIHNWWISGNDKYGNLVMCAPLGRLWLRTICENGESAVYIRYVIREWYTLINALKAQSKGKEWMCQAVVICDFDGLTYSQFWSWDAIKLGHLVVKLWQLQFPEILRKLFAINIPPAFRLVEKFLYPLIDDRTLSKMCLLGGERDTWRKEIGSLVPLSSFPKMYGGDGDNDYDMKGNFAL